MGHENMEDSEYDDEYAIMFIQQVFDLLILA